jgi:hypothetical protein
MPYAISRAILKDASSLPAVAQVEEDVIRDNAEHNQQQAQPEELTTSLIDEAFEPMETSLADMEALLGKVRQAAHEVAKSQSYQAIEAIQVAAIAQTYGVATAVAQAKKVAQR